MGCSRRTAVPRFDAYKKAIDCLKPGDVAILATPRLPLGSFLPMPSKGRPRVHGEPVTVDGPTPPDDRVGKKADEKNLKVGSVHGPPFRGRQELLKRIRDGQIGEIIALRAYRMAQRSGTCGAPPQGMSEVLFQIARFHSFLWASGGLFSDYFIHQIDECS